MQLQCSTERNIRGVQHDAHDIIIVIPDSDISGYKAMAVSHSFIKSRSIITQGIGKGRYTFRLQQTLFYPDNENRNFNFLCALFRLVWLEYAAKVVKCRSEGPRLQLGEHILVRLLRAAI